MDDNKVYIVTACRTPIGKIGGVYRNVSVVDLGAKVIKESVIRAGLKNTQIDHVCMGCVLQAGAGQNVARQAAVKAGLTYDTTAETINSVCGSGMEAINLAARLIKTGDADIVIAGGMENMSMSPYILKNARYGYRMGNAEIVDSMISDALWDVFYDCHMGKTAENICVKWNISRKELDNYAFESQIKAIKAMENDVFADEIVPVVIKEKTTEKKIICDESIRKDISLEKLAELKPAFVENGKVTAGNSTGISDGAAAVLLISEKKLHELNIKPMAQWIDGTMAGVDPEIMGIGPVASTKKLLSRLNMEINDLDLYEINEAFAAQSIAVERELGLVRDRLNVNGGAIALGHPVGASGCRIIVTLMHEMKRRKSNLGLASLCIGGGMGCSTIIKNIV